MVHWRNKRNDKNMPLPEPIPYKNAVIGFLLLFGGIPTGIIGYSYLVKKYVRLNCTLQSPYLHL